MRTILAPSIEAAKATPRRAVAGEMSTPADGFLSLHLEKTKLEQMKAFLEHRTSKVYFVGTIMGLSLGGLLAIAGFVLSILGLSGSIEWLVKTPGLTSKLTNASPGVVFALLGLVIFWRYKPRLKYNVTFSSGSVTTASQDEEMFI